MQTNAYTPKVSVVVPVYNAASTLPACLGNLVHQTLQDIEIILVDDASTDNSFQILSDCEAAFPDKIILIHLDDNLGPGGARNVGLSYAHGEYVGFVDSDDLADPTMYETLYKLASDNDYDMVDCAYYNKATDSLFLQTEDNCIGHLDTQKRIQLISEGGYLWSRLYKYELFHNLSFREHVTLEDIEILMELFLRTKKLGSTKKTLYKYSASPNSASKANDFVKSHNAILQAMQAVYTTLHSTTNYEDYQSVCEFSLLNLYKCGIQNILQQKSRLPSLVEQKAMHELYMIRAKFVQISIKKNEIVLHRLSNNEIQLIQTFDNHFL